MKSGFIEKSINATAEELERINRLSKRKLAAEEVYVFSARFCDTLIDRDFERFSESTIDELAKLFIGKTGIFDHSAKAANQIARAFECESVFTGETDENGNPVKVLKAKAYIPRTEKNAPIIEDIESGIKKEISVSCSVRKKICSICGKELGSRECSHRKGAVYGGELCYAILEGAQDAYEWSFVAVPAQKKAGVIKSFISEKGDFKMENIKKALAAAEEGITIDKAFADKLISYIEKLEKQAESAAAYKNELVAQVSKLCAVALPSMEREGFLKIADNLSVEELLIFKKAFGDKANDIAPMELQLADEKQIQKFDNSQFDI